MAFSLTEEVWSCERVEGRGCFVWRLCLEEVVVEVGINSDSRCGCR